MKCSNCIGEREGVTVCVCAGDDGGVVQCVCVCVCVRVIVVCVYTCLRRFSLVALSVEENSFTTHGTIRR